LANGWSLHTPIVDLHHRVNNHARHTGKMRPSSQTGASITMKNTPFGDIYLKGIFIF
jgi:hypothetical protein